MNSGSGMTISPQALAVLVAVAVLVVMSVMVWLYTSVMRRTLHSLALTLVIYIGATALIIVVTGVSGLIPGFADARTTQFSPFSLEFKGQLAVLVVAIFAIYGAATYTLKRLLRLYPKPPRQRRPPERPHLVRKEGYLPPDTP